MKKYRIIFVSCVSFVYIINNIQTKYTNYMTSFIYNLILIEQDSCNISAWNQGDYKGYTLCALIMFNSNVLSK